MHDARWARKTGLGPKLTIGCGTTICWRINDLSSQDAVTEEDGQHGIMHKKKKRKTKTSSSINIEKVVLGITISSFSGYRTKTANAVY